MTDPVVPPPQPDPEPAAQALARLLADNMSEAFCLLDREFRILQVNSEAVRLDGRTADDLIGRTHWDVWPGSVGSVVEANYRRAMKGEPVTFEHRYQAGEQDVWLSLKAVPCPQGLALFYRNVGRSRRAADRFAEVNRRLNAVLDNASVAIFLMDEHQHCAYMNAAAEKLTGYTLAETQGRPLHDVIHHTRPDGSHYPLEECPIDRALPDRANLRGEEVFVHKDGRFYTVAFTASPILDETSRTIGTIIEVRDITAEKALAAARELLMREVDHRARNALMIVQSILRLTRAPDIAAFKAIVAGRVDALARSQGTLAAQKWESASLRRLIREELSALAPAGRFATKGPEVNIRPDHVQPLTMLIHELVTNAIKHGALKDANGDVRVSWTASSGLRITWQERGGPRLSGPPIRNGFGARLIAQLIAQTGGSVAHEWRPEGLLVQLTIPNV